MSAILTGISQILSSPYGSMAYHLMVTFALVSALHPALSINLSAPSIKSRRLTFGFFLLIALRMVIFLAAGLSIQGILGLDLLLPVVEQAINSLSLLIIIWMWSVQEPDSTYDPSAILTGIIILFAAGLSLVSWSTQGLPNTYISSNLALYWWIFDALMISGGSLLLFTRNAEDQISGLVMFLTIFIGYIYQIIQTQGVPGDFSIPIRLTQIATYPLMIGLAHRLFILPSPQNEVDEEESIEVPIVDQEEDTPLEIPEQSETPEPIEDTAESTKEELLESKEETAPAEAEVEEDLADLQSKWDSMTDSLVEPAKEENEEAPEADLTLETDSTLQAEDQEQTEGVETPFLLKTSTKGFELKIFQNILGLAAAQNNEELFAYLTLNLANAMVADICLLITTPDSNGQILMLDGYDLITQEHLGMSSFDQKLIPGFQKAIQRGRPLQIPEAQSKKLAGFAKALYLNGVGNFLSYPLINENGEPFAAIILVSPYSNHVWSADDMAYLQATAKTLSVVAKRFQPTEESMDIEEIEALEQQVQTDELLAKIESLEQENTELAKQLEESPDLTDELVTQINKLELEKTELDHKLNETQPIQEEMISHMERLEKEKTELNETIQGLENKLNASIAHDILEHTSADEIQEMQQKFNALQEELQQAQTQVNQLGAENQAIKDSLQKSVELSDLATGNLPEETPAEGTPTSTRVLPPIQDDTETAQRALLLEEELRQSINKVNTLNSELQNAQQKISELEEAFNAVPQPQAAPEPESQPTENDLALSPEQAELITSIVQDLRQPMSSIGGYIDLLLSESVGILGALQRKFLDRVKASSERMNTLISDLLQLTALDSGGVELTAEAVELNSIMDEVIGTTSAQLREKNIILRVDLPLQLPKMTTDKDALNQILTHLLQNAEAATPKEGEITLKAEMNPEDNDLEEDAVLISVTDTGEGIPEDDIARVFSRLYRADNPLIQGVGDTGVGLSIAKTLTEALGGKIWVNSQPGVGSTFSVLLPCSPNGTGMNGEIPE